MASEKRSAMAAMASCGAGVDAFTGRKMLPKVLPLLLVSLVLAGCGGRDRDMTLQCEGARRLVRGNVEAPLAGVRQAEQMRTERYELKGRKLDGVYECNVWSASEIRCTHSKPDGTLSRTFAFDREAMRVREEVFSRGRTLTEQVTFEGECMAQ